MPHKAYLPLCLCCLPALFLLAVVSLKVLPGPYLPFPALLAPWEASLLFLASLACPLTMGVMMWRMRRGATRTNTHVCCRGAQPRPFYKEENI